MAARKAPTTETPVPEPGPEPTAAPKPSERPVTVGRIVHVYTTPAAAPLAAIVTEVTSAGPTLAVFTPRGGTNIAAGMPHADAQPEHYRGPVWRWPQEAS